MLAIGLFLLIYNKVHLVVTCLGNVLVH